MSKQIGQAKAKGEDAAALMAEWSAVNAEFDELKQLGAREDAGSAAAISFGRIPNMPHASVPGRQVPEADNVEQRRWGSPRSFDFPVKDHVDVGEGLGMLDLATATKIAGARFSLLKGALARLHRALAQFMLDVHTQEHGYTEVYVPYMVTGNARQRAVPKFGRCSRTTCSRSRAATST